MPDESTSGPISNSIKLLTLVSTVLTIAFTYWQFNQACAPTPLWECLWTGKEEVARKEWESQVARSTSKAEIASFLERFPTVRVAGAAKVRLAAAEAWEAVRDVTDPTRVRGFLDRHPDPVFADLARARLENLDRQAWSAADKTATRAAYEDYLAAFPQGRAAAQAGTRLRAIADDEHWARARGLDTIEAYRAYETHAPGGRHSAAAKARLAELQEAYDWTRAATERNAQRLREHLRQYPSGRNAREAGELLRRLDDEHWRRVEANPTLTNLHAYLSEWPAGSHAGAAAAQIARLDDTAWEEARKSPTLRTLRAYLTDFANGRHAPEALLQIAELEDAEAWTLAERTGTSEAYRRYLAASPPGRHSATARQRLALLEDDAAWLRARNLNTREGYERYRRERQSGRYSEELERRLAELEEAAWQQASAADTAATYQAYMSDWPQGRNAAKASKRLEDLRQGDECDRLAGNPDDPSHRGAGVPFRDLVPEPAIAACERALQLSPQETRYKYQLARAHQKAGNWPPAHKLLQELTRTSHLPSYDNLGWMHARGQGVVRNERTAEEMFRFAANRGHAESMFSLYLLLANRRPDDAERWRQRAASAGYGPAREAPQPVKPGSPQDLSKGVKDFGEAAKSMKEVIDVFKSLRRKPEDR